MMEPTMNDLERRQRRGSLSRSTVSLRSRICVFVLGPSAAGKTFLTFSKLPRVLHLNGLTLDGANFVSVDGGLMRDTSMVWKYTKSLPVRSVLRMLLGILEHRHSNTDTRTPTLKHQHPRTPTGTTRTNRQVLGTRRIQGSSLQVFRHTRAARTISFVDCWNKVVTWWFQTLLRYVTSLRGWCG